MKKMVKSLTKLFETLESQKFYGAIIVKFENGRVVHIMKKESLLDPKTGILKVK